MCTYQRLTYLLTLSTYRCADLTFFIIENTIANTVFFYIKFLKLHGAGIYNFVLKQIFNSYFQCFFYPLYFLKQRLLCQMFCKINTMFFGGILPNY